MGKEVGLGGGEAPCKGSAWHAFSSTIVGGRGGAFDGGLGDFTGLILFHTRDLRDHFCYLS